MSTTIDLDISLGCSDADGCRAEVSFSRPGEPLDRYKPRLVRFERDFRCRTTESTIG